jgi:hypothetical protein
MIMLFFHYLSGKLKKYVGLMEDYLEKIKPGVDDAWRTGELYLKIRGNIKYLYV